MIAELSDPMFMKWNGKHDMMMTKGKTYLFVFSKERMRPVFMGVDIGEKGFELRREDIILPEKIDMSLAPNGFGKKLLKV